MEEEKKVAIIIAMKGHPGTGKTTLARAIASTLKCPLIDKDDIRDCTQTLQHLPPSLLNDMCYDVVFQVASTQLILGLNSMVVDTPLSRAAHLHRLLKLANESGAKVVVVECRPNDECEWRRRLEMRGEGDCDKWQHKPSTWQDMERLLESYGGCWDYDVGEVPKLVVDTTAPVGVGELVSSVLEFIASYGGRWLDIH